MLPRVLRFRRFGRGAGTREGPLPHDVGQYGDQRAASGSCCHLRDRGRPELHGEQFDVRVRFRRARRPLVRAPESDASGGCCHRLPLRCGDDTQEVTP